MQSDCPPHGGGNRGRATALAEHVACSATPRMRGTTALLDVQRRSAARLQTSRRSRTPVRQLCSPIRDRHGKPPRKTERVIDACAASSWRAFRRRVASRSRRESSRIRLVDVRYVQSKAYSRHRFCDASVRPRMLTHLDDRLPDAELRMADTAYGCCVAFEFCRLEDMTIEVHGGSRIAHDQVRAQRSEIGTLVLRSWNVRHQHILPGTGAARRPPSRTDHPTCRCPRTPARRQGGGRPTPCLLSRARHQWRSLRVSGSRFGCGSSLLVACRRCGRTSCS